MPAKGKHRRPKSNPITRGFVVAGTGGAAIALPLFGATAANAAPAAAPAAAPEKAAAAATASAPAAAQGAAAQGAEKAPKTYTVVAGDYLSKIADEQDVRGGWKQLFNDNRRAIGADPSLIHPGLELTIGAKSKAKNDPEPRSESKARPSRDDSRSTAPQAEAPAKKAPAKETSTPASGSGFSAPVDAGVTTAYRASGAMWSSGYHTGVDFAAPSGSSVKAVATGTVVSAGWGGAYGNEVVIQHTDGTYSQYAHLSSLGVSSGQSVTGGQQIGLSGSTGNSSGPHLHFEVRTGPSYGSDIDPLAYLREHGVSL
ncbi:peptidoglycan DD-metalloendopeptidase family protein [Streptomyces sp. NPDC003023]|uniref:M23 family metallopeptidase n=1 Tax=Streptomyces sp. NPDC003023 TaxID=3364675 RepID=UPI0036A44ECB